MQKIIEVIKRQRFELLGDLIAVLCLVGGVCLLFVLAAAFQPPIN